VPRRRAHCVVRAWTHPVIVAGDTNLPEGSGIFADTFGQLQDVAFEVGAHRASDHYAVWADVERRR